MVIITLGILLIISTASATEYVLNSSSIEQFKNGINYNGGDELIIVIDDNVTIQSATNAGIQSAAPITIRSPANSTLTIIVNNDTERLFGIKAPSVSIESGVLDISVRGRNDSDKGQAFGIFAGSGNATISGGTITTNVNTTGHKNKGMFASGFITVSGGRIVTNQTGGENTFGFDGGSGGNSGGVMISGGNVEVFSTRGTQRNLGMDSFSGTIGISGNPVIIIYEDENGTVQNYPYNPHITTISGGNAVVFTSAGGNFTLRENAVLTQTASLIADRTFEIPAGLKLGISEGTDLQQPADTTFLFGGGYGMLTNATTTVGENGDIIYDGNKSTPSGPVSFMVILAGFCIAVILIRRR